MRNLEPWNPGPAAVGSAVAIAAKSYELPIGIIAFAYVNNMSDLCCHKSRSRPQHDKKVLLTVDRNACTRASDRDDCLRRPDEDLVNWLRVIAET